MAIGKSFDRTDAVAKVTGRAEYTEDIQRQGMLAAKYLRSTISHGKVVRIDCSKARSLEGVEAVFTFEDVPDRLFATAGHPFSLNPHHKDIEDRLLLTGDVRYMGDEIAIAVATDEVTAARALELVEVEYEEYVPLIRPEDILADGAREIHEGRANIAGKHSYTCGGDIAQAFGEAGHVLEAEFTTAMVQHCHLENHIAYAYMDDMDRIVIVSSTQIPHIARRIVGEALSIPLSKVRVIKPYIGGGFGNKQDVILEPMVAFLTRQLDGRPVQINMSREECMLCTRNRHPFFVNVRTGVNEDGRLVARELDVISITGAYASHGHAIAAAGGAKQSVLYPRTTASFKAKTIYANIPSAGAMRAYGSPQILYALECATEDAARKIGMDSVEFRLKNVARQGEINPLNGEVITSCGLTECLIKGRDFIGWEEKKKAYAAYKSGNIRKGLGVACLSYASGTYPVCVEIAGARLVLNQDGSVHVMVGATEIGQGSDTVVAQMVAETLGIPYRQVRMVQSQDTDMTPFDTGAYASRQAYVVSNAVYRAASELRDKIFAHAVLMTGKNPDGMDLVDGKLIERGSGAPFMELSTLAMDSYYHKERGGQLSAEVSHKTTSNAPVFGCTFVDIEVDIALCRIKVNQIINVHDSGVILNPLQAAGQVHGGIFMGIGAALSEEILIDPESGYVYNNNLLDYKFPTFMDMPELSHDFVETFEPSSGYGNKALGEPPIITPPPAIRNALLDATGVAINSLPLTPHRLYHHFVASGLLVDRGEKRV